MNQVALPVDIRPEEVARKHSLGGALELCAELAGFSLDKELQQALGVDKAQFSRWTAGTEGIVWPKFSKLMDACGNDAPHRIELLEPIGRKNNPIRCWTVFITGPRVREWGFHCPQGWVHWKRFTAPGDKGSVGKGCEA